jgi:SAM-dependent methyltransferase
VSRSSFITFRRYHIDRFLESVHFRGRVLDVGGKKNNKRGSFRPPVDIVEVWEYLNIDPGTEPDYCCSAEKIPQNNETFDYVLLCEVLEHLQSPNVVLDECLRVLKPGGKLLITMPFMIGIHGDPEDYQRWTSSLFRLELEKKRGMDIEQIQPMGGIWAVYWDCMYSAGSPGGPEFRKKFSRFILYAIKDVFLYLEKIILSDGRITTGFAVLAKKK